MLYLWKIPDEYPENMIGEYQKDVSPDRFEFRKGETLPENIGTPKFKFKVPLSELEGVGDLCNNARLPLLSEDVISILVEFASDSVQLFDAIVEGSDGVSEGYKLVNIKKLVAGIDHDKSEYTKVPGTDQIMNFKSLSYIEGCMGDVQLARDEEYRGNLLVNSNLAEKLMELRKKGIALCLPEDME